MSLDSKVEDNKMTPQKNTLLWVWLFFIYLLLTTIIIFGGGEVKHRVSAEDFIIKSHEQTHPTSVLRGGDSEMSLFIEQAEVSFIETCKLHTLLIGEKNNEQRTAEYRDTHRGGNGIYCPAPSERDSTAEQLGSARASQGETRSTNRAE